MTELTEHERKQIGEILERRANEIAIYSEDKSNSAKPASVGLALQREIERLRHLAKRIDPPTTFPFDE